VHLPLQRRRIDVVIDQQEREQRHQVDDGIVEHFHGEEFARRMQQHDRVIEKSRTEH